MNNSLNHRIRQKAELLFSAVKAYREHLHQFPELSYEEHETMHFVAETLKRLGISHQIAVGKTGVVGLIKGKHHTEDMACIGLRSELDALPIQEENDVPYKSTKEGIMHACGHDVHTAILLGTAEILHELRDELPYPVKLIFQPGEEKNPGGATLMLADGVLEFPTVSQLYALHVFPEMDAGKVGVKSGIYMASSDEIHLTIHGKGGHGAMPHDCVDPIVIGASIVMQLQQVVSRKCDPKVPCVLTFGHFEAIGATNIIPSKAVLKGTFRTMDEGWREEALRLIEKHIRSIAESNGATVDLTISRGYPYLENNPALTLQFKEKAIEFLGEENVIDLPIRMTSEDFAFYSHTVPVCFFRLGVRNEDKGIVYGVHHPRFDSDDKALKTGMEIMTRSCFG